MNQRYYFYIYGKPDTPPERRKLMAIRADGEKSAALALFRSLGGFPFQAISVGSLSQKDLEEAVLPPAKLDDPINTISALKYVEAEYGEVLGAKEVKNLKRIRKKLFNHVFEI